MNAIIAANYARALAEAGPFVPKQYTDALCAFRRIRDEVKQAPALARRIFEEAVRNAIDTEDFDGGRFTQDEFAGFVLADITGLLCCIDAVYRLDSPEDRQAAKLWFVYRNVNV